MTINEIVNRCEAGEVVVIDNDHRALRTIDRLGRIKRDFTNYHIQVDTIGHIIWIFKETAHGNSRLQRQAGQDRPQS